MSSVVCLCQAGCLNIERLFWGGFKLSTEIDACKWLSCEVVGERDVSGDLD